MIVPRPDAAPEARHPDEVRVGRRAAAALVLLLIGSLTGIGVVLSHSFRQQQLSRVTAHLTVALQAALGEASREATEAQQQAAALAAQPRLQHALVTKDTAAVHRIEASVPGAAVVPGNRAISQIKAPSLRRAVRVIAKGQVIGTVTVTVPLDGATLARLRAAAPLAPGEGILFVRAGQALTGGSGVSSSRLPPDAQSISLDGVAYRVVQTRLVGGPAPVRLAAFAPYAEITRPVDHSDRLLAAALTVTFLALLLLARLLARPVLTPFLRLAQDARSSGTDDLTKLANRRAFTEAAAAEVVRARRSGQPLAIALIDLDDFKQINDTFGHSTGDRILRDVAEVLREHFREIDLPSRLGGEEFAVLLPETNLTGAREAAERFITALAEARFGDDHTGMHAITASAGVAAATTPEIDVLLETADRALYRAKKCGKNQVQVEAT